MNRNDNEINFFDTIDILSSNRKSIFYFSGIITALSILYILFATPYYLSYISINPVNEDHRSPIGGLQGLATTFGMDMGGINENAFYIPDIVDSRHLKKAVIQNNWKTEKYTQNVNLIEYWEINDESGFSVKNLFQTSKDTNLNIKYMELAIETLANQISVTEEESGLIVISVLMEESELAADIANFIALYIKKYISEVMLIHSSRHREFIEERLSDSKIELSISEEELTEFRSKHPIAMDTPDLQLQRGRLLRNVEVNQQVYVTLREQYEVARIDELKEIPVINILDQGEASSTPEKPKKMLIVLLAFISSFLLSSLYTIILKEINKDN